MKAGLELNIEKCQFEVTEVDFLGRTITPQGIAPKTTKSKNSWQLWDSQSQKTSANMYWVRELLPHLHSGSDRKNTRIL